jgi:putative ABC transport system permease protein
MAEVRQAALLANPRASVTELRAVSEIIGEATRQPAFRMTLLLGFGVLTLLLVAIGVYGLVSQTVTQRVREVAVRLALGADPHALVATIMRHAVIAAIAGLGFGAIGAMMLGRALEALLYGVQPRDLVSFVAAAVALLAVTSVAAIIPALRATSVDPTRVLRGD